MISFQQINSPDSILYYGGSFNPPHIAHIMMVSVLKAYFPMAEILVAPTYRHAFEKSLMPFEQRMDMLNKCFGHIEKVSLSTIERDICIHDGSSKSYTFDVVWSLKSSHPEKKIWIVVGSDIIPTLHKWYRYEDILNMANFLVFPREGYDNSSAFNIPHLPEVSSTEIRELLKNGDPDNRLPGLVPACVLELLK